MKRSANPQGLPEIVSNLYSERGNYFFYGVATTYPGLSELIGIVNFHAKHNHGAMFGFPEKFVYNAYYITLQNYRAMFKITFHTLRDNYLDGGLWHPTL